MLIKFLYNARIPQIFSLEGRLNSRIIFVFVSYFREITDYLAPLLSSFYISFSEFTDPISSPIFMLLCIAID